MSKSNCIHHAGQIFILCIWVEKRLADFMLLKKKPELCHVINIQENLPEEFVKLRLKTWEKDTFTPELVENFCSTFNTQEPYKTYLSHIPYWRDVIGHCHISLYRDYILYTSNRKEPYLKKMLEAFGTPYKEGDLALKTFTINLSDNAFQHMSKKFTDLDEIYFRGLAKELGLDYEKIR
jgi:hypothetical protein